MNTLAAIHASAKKAGLDEDTRRDLMERVTGKRSAKDMTEAERVAIVAEMQRLSAPVARSRLSGPYAKKLQALWIAGWNLGLVRDRRDEALETFIKRQTGLDSARWLHQAGDAKKAVEALKKWLERDGGVYWPVSKGLPEFAAQHGYKIARAQWHILSGGEAAPDSFWPAVSAILKRAVITVKPDAVEWITVMNEFGRRIRALPSRTA